MVGLSISQVISSIDDEISRVNVVALDNSLEQLRMMYCSIALKMKML